MPDYMVKRKLPVDLTDDELLTLGSELAKDEQDLSGVENEKKEVMADFTAKINAVKSRIEIASLKISTKREYRDVECKVHIYPQAFRKEIERQDTMEVVAKEKLTQDDLQNELQFIEREDEA
ncbi:MAG: hypothetical protein CMB80_01935 [Flammeovirgaceae bacterium]|mgnify:CR=1 FL=1|nr:hypothetical protein [Flammeovirgaceae bacterium]